MPGGAAGLYLNSGLDQVQAQRQRLAHEHVGVVALVEGFLQLLQLPAGEVGARPPPLAAWTLLVWVAGVCGRAQDAAPLSRSPGRPPAPGCSGPRATERAAACPVPGADPGAPFAAAARNPNPVPDRIP